MVPMPKHHGIQFQFLKPLSQSRIDAREHLSQITDPGHFPKPLCLEAIQADIDPFDACCLQFAGILLKMRAIRSDDQLAQTRQPPDLPHQSNNAFANQWLAAGNTYLVDSQSHEGLTQQSNFLQCENLGTWQEFHLFAHAIEATKITAIRDGNPDIVNDSTKTVMQGGLKRALTVHGTQMGLIGKNSHMAQVKVQVFYSVFSASTTPLPPASSLAGTFMEPDSGMTRGQQDPVPGRPGLRLKELFGVFGSKRYRQRRTRASCAHCVLFFAFGGT